MKEETCENVLMATMAVFDGEKTEFSPEQLNSHLAGCKNCRDEIEQMQNTFNLLKDEQRRGQEADLWFEIETGIGAQNASQISLKPFVLLGIFLVGYKLLEMLPEDEFGLWFKFVPLVFVIALFGFLKENPFKINTELILEK